MKCCSVLQMWKPDKLNEFLKVTEGVNSNFKQNPADWHLNDRLTINLHFDSLAAVQRRTEASKSNDYILISLCIGWNRDIGMGQQLIQSLKTKLRGSTAAS